LFFAFQSANFVEVFHCVQGAQRKGVVWGIVQVHGPNSSVLEQRTTFTCERPTLALRALLFFSAGVAERKWEESSGGGCVVFFAR
jgi:hypothetical protein